MTFTATLTGSGGATHRQRDVHVDGAAQTPAAFSGTTATFATTALSVGAHSITATYGGNTE